MPASLREVEGLAYLTTVLAYPNLEAKFILHTDASGEGSGAVLEQEQDGKLHPVAYTSRTQMKKVRKTME